MPTFQKPRLQPNQLVKGSIFVPEGLRIKGLNQEVQAFFVLRHLNLSRHPGLDPGSP